MIVLSTAFSSETCATMIWLHILQPKTAIDLKLYSSMSLSVIGTAVGCDDHWQITVGNATQPMTENWLQTFVVISMYTANLQSLAVLHFPL